jgi:lipoate-protein ligase A
VTRRIRVLRGESPGSAARDTALSRLLLTAVLRGDATECLRIWRPCDAFAFSALDRTRIGFEGAVRAAREAGFEPFLRLTGGHAAVYTDATAAFAWTVPAPEPHRGIRERFDVLAELVAASLRDLGIDAHVGPVAGEYCPGAHSVNARGRVKLMGVGRGGGRTRPRGQTYWAQLFGWARLYARYAQHTG